MIYMGIKYYIHRSQSGFCYIDSFENTPSDKTWGPYDSLEEAEKAAKELKMKHFCIKIET